jgi:two-component system sensor kinase FixL
LDVIALVRSDAAVRHVALAHSIPPGLPHVFGDRIQLSQVLLNLIMNGMEAVNGAADGARNIIIAAKVGSPGTVEISVTDSGSGIPPELMTKIFDPFVTTKAKGMGIGLAVSRTIIENHGGKLWAENNARPGATFFFSLPAAKETGE